MSTHKAKKFENIARKIISDTLMQDVELDNATY